MKTDYLTFLLGISQSGYITIHTTVRNINYISLHSHRLSYILFSL